MAAIEGPTLASRIRRSDEVLFQELQDEAVLLDLKSGLYFGLDGVGTRIWQLFAEHELLSEIAQTIVAEYDVAEDRCETDLLALVTELEREGLVTISDTDRIDDIAGEPPRVVPGESISRANSKR